MTQSKAKKSVNFLLKQQGWSKGLAIMNLSAGFLWLMKALTNDLDGFGSKTFWQALVWLLIGIGYTIQYRTVKTFDAYLSELQSNANEIKP